MYKEWHKNELTDMSQVDGLHSGFHCLLRLKEGSF